MKPPANDKDLAKMLGDIDKMFREHETGRTARWAKLDRALKQEQAALDRALTRNATRSTSHARLPKGISGGKVAAVVAGVGLVAGGLYAWSRHTDKAEKSWAERVEAQRTAQINQGLAH